VHEDDAWQLVPEDVLRIPEGDDIPEDEKDEQIVKLLRGENTNFGACKSDGPGPTDCNWTSSILMNCDNEMSLKTVGLKAVCLRPK